MREKLLTVFIILLFIFSYSIPVYALDEVIDDYTDYSGVQARNDVVRNITFDCMELDFTLTNASAVDMDIWTTGGFTEVDVGADHLKNVNGTRIWFDNVDRDEGDRIYKDYGANYFDASWEYHFRVYITSSHTDNARCIFMMIAETNEHQTDMITNDRDWVEFFVQWKTVGSQWELYLRMWDEGVVDAVDSEPESGALQLNHWYHVIYIRNGNNVTGWFYNDALMTDLDFMLTVSTSDVTDLRYLHPLNSQDQATGGRAMDLHLNKVHNFTLVSSYENNGYFYTTELISGIGGNTVELLTNATIPSDDTLTVEFSSDNATWVNHNGIGGSDTIVAGNESIDLRDLSYLTLYMRFNFTNGASDSTPRLYQIWVITNAIVSGDGIIYPLVLYGIVIIFLVTVGVALTRKKW